MRQVRVQVVFGSKRHRQCLEHVPAKHQIAAVGGHAQGQSQDFEALRGIHILRSWLAVWPTAGQRRGGVGEEAKRVPDAELDEDAKADAGAIDAMLLTPHA